MGHAIRLIALAVLCVLACVARSGAVDPEAPGYSGPAWPEGKNDPGTSLDQRFQQFDRALEFLRDQLQVMRNDLDENSGHAAPAMRRKEEGFRGIYTVNADGSQAEFLTAAPGMIANVDPRWSHDARMVAFDGLPTVDTPVQAKVFVYAAQGPFKGKLRDYGFGNTPDWSPDDKQIAYMINPGNPIEAQGGAWIMNADGTHRRWITNGWFPRWSPDGKTLLCHGVDGQATLTVTNLATGQTRDLLKAPGWRLKTYGGNWSPDGKRVVFVGVLDGKERLATIDSSGDDNSIRILYTNEDPTLSMWGPPAWSPDGKQIVLNIGDQGGGPRQWWHTYLYSLPAEPAAAAKPKLVEAKKTGNINRAPAFSPDGTKIIFSSER